MMLRPDVRLLMRRPGYARAAAASDDPARLKQATQRRQARRRIALALILMLLLAAVLLTQSLRRQRAVPGWTLRSAPVQPTIVPLAPLLRAFDRVDNAPSAGDYDALARHFLEGWSAYRSPEGERAHYPGLPSDAGREADGLEGFARMLPLAAVRWSAGHTAPLATRDGPIDLPSAFRHGMLVGTDPGHPAYWGDIQDHSPQLVEAADIALGLWIGREQLWQPMSAEQRAQVGRWLSGALSSLPHEGNWQLFPMIVHRVLRDLGVDVRRFDARIESNWDHFRSFHRGGGWFIDPPHGFDYYNAWGVHYALYWLRRIDPAFEPTFIGRAQGEFAAFERHLFSRRGHPLMGRSVCYRMAAPVPLLAAQLTAPGAVDVGEALRALDTTWSWFLRQRAVSAGAPTSGFCDTDPALQARYSGPASCLWSLRSLVVALDGQARSGLLEHARAPLPVERGDFSVRHAVPGWTVQGQQAHQLIELVIESHPPQQLPWRDHGWVQRVGEVLLQSPRRPDNHDALYARRVYPNAMAREACSR